MQRFISGLPQTYQDRIEFDEPKTLEETIQKARYCYEQFGSKTRDHKYWRKRSSSGFQNNGFKSSILKNYGKYSRWSLPTKSVYQQNFPSQSGNKPFNTSTYDQIFHVFSLLLRHLSVTISTKAKTIFRRYIHEPGVRGNIDEISSPGVITIKIG
jgi:hypothetical protein